jgi:two-component system cell cycle response regulator
LTHLARAAPCGERIPFMLSPYMPPGSSRFAAVLLRVGLFAFAFVALVSAAWFAAPVAPFGVRWPWLWLVALGSGVLMLVAAGAIFWQMRQQSHDQVARQAAAPLRVMPPVPDPPSPDAAYDTAPMRATPHATPTAPHDPHVLALQASVRELLALAQEATQILEGQRAAMQDLQAARAALPASAAFDPVTGAITHTALMTRLSMDVAFAAAHDRPLALAIFDVADFRAINRRHGYRFGDEVLFAVAERIRQHVDEGDLFARLGADRFALARPGADFAAIQPVVERVLAAVAHAPLLVLREEATLPSHHEELRVALHAGVAFCPDDGTTAEALLDAASAVLLPAHEVERPPGANRTVIAQNPLRDAPDMVPQPIPLAELLRRTGADAAPPVSPLSDIDALSRRYSSIHALTSAMEAQSLTTASEVRNLAELAQETALRLGRAPEEARLVGLAALLHDVGSLGIPPAITHKADPLTAEEWAFVREHPHLGERMLTSVGGVLAAIAPIVAAHRERWDGLGYPAGLRGEAIPLGARIVAVCDVYGALIAARPYRAAFSHADALAELERNAGTQFDPDVVHAFIAVARP